MKVTCGSCGAVHDVEPPGWLVSTGRAFHMACPGCGADMAVRPNGLAMLDSGSVSTPGSEPPPTAPPPDDQPGQVPPPPLAATTPTPAPAPPAPPSTPSATPSADRLVLRQDGERYLVKDVATLQRWIMEQRIDPEDELQIGAGPFRRMADLPAYSVFFDAVDRLERRVEAPDGPTTGLTDAAPDTAKVKPPPPRRPRMDESATRDGWTEESPPIPTDMRPRTDEDGLGFDPPSQPSSPPMSGVPIDEAGAAAVSLGDEFNAWSDDDFDASAYRSNRSVGLWLGIGAALVLALGLWVVFGTGAEDAILQPEETAAAAEAPTPAPIEPAPIDEAPADDEPEPSPEPEPRPEPPSEPEPGPKPKPAPARTTTRTPTRASTPQPAPEPTRASPPPRPAPSTRSEPPVPQLAGQAPQDASFEVLIEAGWSAVDRTDPLTSLAMFQRAVELKPSSVEAAYGLGYALLESGRPSAASRYLCRALVRGDASMVAEIRGLMSRRNLACP